MSLALNTVVWNVNFSRETAEGITLTYWTFSNAGCFALGVLFSPLSKDGLGLKENFRS